MARHYGGMRTRGAGNARRSRQPPAETMEIYLPALTFGKIVQAAAEFGVTVDELMEEAAQVILHAKAAELFEREFYQARREAEQSMQPSPVRHEFERSFRKPAWSKETPQRPSPSQPG